MAVQIIVATLTVGSLVGFVAVAVLGLRSVGRATERTVRAGGTAARLAGVAVDTRGFPVANARVAVEGQGGDKREAITDARGGLDERIFVRGDKKVDYGTVMRVMGRLSQAGFRRVALVTEVDQG